MEKPYRPCVLAVFTNSDGRVMVCERKYPRGAWQFPQGGIDPGEDPRAALVREMREELGPGEFRVIAEAAQPVRYDFPPGFDMPIAREWSGQEQVWFHVQWHEGNGPDLGRAEHDEFISFDWISVAEIMKRVVEFKRESYRQGLRLLNLL